MTRMPTRVQIGPFSSGQLLECPLLGVRNKHAELWIERLASRAFLFNKQEINRKYTTNIRQIYPKYTTNIRRKITIIRNTKTQGKIHANRRSMFPAVIVCISVLSVFLYFCISVFLFVFVSIKTGY